MGFFYESTPEWNGAEWTIVHPAELLGFAEEQGATEIQLAILEKLIEMPGAWSRAQLAEMMERERSTWFTLQIEHLASMAVVSKMPGLSRYGQFCWVYAAACYQAPLPF